MAVLLLVMLPLRRQMLQLFESGLDDLTESSDVVTPMRQDST